MANLIFAATTGNEFIHIQVTSGGSDNMDTTIAVDSCDIYYNVSEAYLTIREEDNVLLLVTSAGTITNLNGVSKSYASILDLYNDLFTILNAIGAGGGGGGSNAYTTISVATAAAGGLTDGQNYAVADIENSIAVTGMEAIFYGVGMPDGTLSTYGRIRHVTDFWGTYYPATDKCHDIVSDLGWTFLFSPLTGNGTIVDFYNNVATSGITGDATNLGGCVMGGVAFGGLTYTPQGGGTVYMKDLVISETTTLDMSDVAHDCTLSGVMQGGTIEVKDIIIHYFPDPFTVTFPAYFENAHGIPDLMIASAIGTQRSTMVYVGTYAISGLEYGSCDYDPVANTIKNSTLEVDLGTLAAAATTIDLAPVAFAGTARVTADAGGNTVDDINNGTDGENYKIYISTDNVIGLQLGGAGNILFTLPSAVGNIATAQQSVFNIHILSGSLTGFVKSYLDSIF